MVHRAVHMGHSSGGDAAWAPHGHIRDSIEFAEEADYPTAGIILWGTPYALITSPCGC